MSDFSDYIPLPEGTSVGDQTVYVIADVHGKIGLLEDALEAIQHDRKSVTGKVTLVQTGDLIDRGLSSKDVVNRIIEASFDFDEFVFTPGNHDAMMLIAMETDDTWTHRWWLENGGYTTVNSFMGKMIDWEDENQKGILGLDIPVDPVYHDMITQRPMAKVIGNVIFAHAGIARWKTVEEQIKDETWRSSHRNSLHWIREDFLSTPVGSAVDNRIVFHGHTIENRHFRYGSLGDLVERHRQTLEKFGRVNNDIGSYLHNQLSVAKIQGDKVSFALISP